MSNEVVFSPGWESWVEDQENRTVMSVGRAVHADVVRGCPVDTGNLRDSMTLINFRKKVSQVISHVRYFPAVELGFHGMEVVQAHLREGRPVREHTRQGNTPAQPFARPALYRRRNLSELP
jgi:hypothetical protein